MTKVINFVGAPSSGKTTLCSLMFGYLKLAGQSVEYIPEYAKQLVWTGRTELLNNQYYVSHRQYELMKSMEGKVDIIVTDGSLVNGMYYNRYNPNNTSNVEKTEDCIKEWVSEFDNIWLFVERKNFPYETAGRIQTEQEAVHVNAELRRIMKGLGYQYKDCTSSYDGAQDAFHHICKLCDVKIKENQGLL